MTKGVCIDSTIGTTAVDYIATTSRMKTGVCIVSTIGTILVVYIASDIGMKRCV
jgi:hypothetical protein